MFLLRIIKQYYPNLNFRVILCNSFRIQNFFNHKDRLPIAMRANLDMNLVVYVTVHPSLTLVQPRDTYSKD